MSVVVYLQCNPIVHREGLHSQRRDQHPPTRAIDILLPADEPPSTPVLRGRAALANDYGWDTVFLFPDHAQEDAERAARLLAALHVLHRQWKDEPYSRGYFAGEAGACDGDQVESGC